jgi:hypothetical protein
VVPHVHFHVIPKPSATDNEGLVIEWPTQNMSKDELKALHEELLAKLSNLIVDVKISVASSYSRQPLSLICVSCKELNDVTHIYESDTAMMMSTASSFLLPS